MECRLKKPGKSAICQIPEDTAGACYNRGDFRPEDLTLVQALEVLRREEENLPNGIFYIYVTDAEGRLRGVLRVRDLLFRPSDLTIRDIMVPEVRAVSVHADQEEIARLFRAYAFSAIPVVDDFQILRGVVTADDLLDIMEEETIEDMQRMVGLSGEETAKHIAALRAQSSPVALRQSYRISRGVGRHCSGDHRQCGARGFSFPLSRAKGNRAHKHSRLSFVR